MNLFFYLFLILILIYFYIQIFLIKTYPFVKVRVIQVYDGDSIAVQNPFGDKEVLRLEGLDAPEKEQNYGLQSQQFLESLCLGKIIEIQKKEKDPYQRTIARLFISYQDINYLMIKEGFAWHYKYFNNEKKLAKAERYAQKRKKGLWQENNPQSPWNYRLNNK